MSSACYIFLNIVLFATIVYLVIMSPFICKDVKKKVIPPCYECRHCIKTSSYGKCCQPKLVEKFNKDSGTCFDYIYCDFARGSRLCKFERINENKEL